MPAPTLGNHERRLGILEDHAQETLRAMNTLVDSVDASFRALNDKIDADVGQILSLLQNLTGVAETGFKSAANQVAELRVEIRSELADLNAKVDQVLIAIAGLKRDQ